jgi:hypothetical protein
MSLALGKTSIITCEIWSIEEHHTSVRMATNNPFLQINSLTFPINFLHPLWNGPNSGLHIGKSPNIYSIRISLKQEYN